MQSKTPEHSPPGHLPPERKVQVSLAPGEVHREEVGEGRGHSTAEGLWELRSACRVRAGPSGAVGLLPMVTFPMECSTGHKAALGLGSGQGQGQI